MEAEKELRRKSNEKEEKGTTDGVKRGGGECKQK